MKIPSQSSYVKACGFFLLFSVIFTTAKLQGTCNKNMTFDVKVK